MIKSVGVKYFILFFSIISVGNADKLYIFYPSTVVRPQVLQKELAEVFSGNDIVVFGRYQDFKARMELDTPDIIITKPELIPQFDDYQTVLQGMQNGNSFEPYVLLSVGKTIATDSLSLATIGVVDFLGKKGMEQLMSSLFNTTLHIKRVIKVEDLIPLLHFNMAQAVLVSQRNITKLQESSNMDFTIQPLPDIRIGIIVIAVRKGTNSAAKKGTLLTLSRHLTALLDIEGWR